MTFIRARRWIAGRLVSLAYWIDPEEPAVMEFWMHRMTDFIISGKSSIKVSVIDEEEMPK